MEASVVYGKFVSKCKIYIIDITEICQTSQVHCRQTYEWIILACFFNLLTGNGVLRVPILYGEIEKLPESAVTVLFSKVKDTSTKSLMDAKQQRFPTLVNDIAFVIRELSEKKLQVNVYT